jgi:outer membrane protein assembly factor BamB
MQFQQKTCQAIVTVLCLLAIPAISLAQWPQFGGLNRDFRASENADSDKSAFGTWSIDLGVGDAAPIVDNFLIYVSEATFTDDGAEAMQVRCIDPTNGSTVWQTITDEKSYTSQDISESFPVRPIASPVAAAGHIVVISYGGIVTCLDQKTGEVQWQHDLVREFSATPIQFGWSTSPWSDGRKVVVACGGAEALVISFNLDNGEVAWKTTAGEAAFGSFAKVSVNNATSHLCYVGRDVLVGFDPSDGKELWSYLLPKPKLTNTVTPLTLPDGQLLVAGQGFDACRRLQVTFENERWNVNDVWESRNYPFYCNWLLDPSTGQYFGYNSVLAGVNLSDGEVNWKSRGWTDANFAYHGDSIVGIRGDGFLAVSSITREGMEVRAGVRAVNDRVWAPPVVVGNTAIIRGRKTLSSIDLNSLPMIDKLPSGTKIDSMTAMYGKKHERITALQEKSQSEASSVRFEDYAAIVADQSIRFDEGDYQALFEALSKLPTSDVSLRIAEDWVKRDPESIVAFDSLIKLLQQSGSADKADTLISQRYVEIEIDVIPPKTTSVDAELYLAGNAQAVGPWKPDGLMLQRSNDGHYRGKAKVPMGNFEFKITQGDWESVEIRLDGRSISNRRRRIVKPMTIQVEVQAWKNEGGHG